MDSPILQPGRPGDLVMIVETAWASLQEIQRTDPGNNDEVRGVAVAAFEALSMWLGLKEVARVEE